MVDSIQLAFPQRNARMMTSSNGYSFRVTSHLCREFTGHRWIPCTKASDAVLWYFFLIFAWTNGWVNNRDPGGLRRHGAHYDVTVMDFGMSILMWHWFVPTVSCLITCPDFLKIVIDCWYLVFIRLAYFNLQSCSMNYCGVRFTYTQYPF